MNRRSVLRAVTLAGLFFALPLKADVIVLVHGWYSNPDTWLASGIVHQLQSQGWQDAGVVAATPSGIWHRTDLGGGPNKVYRASLPSEAPLQVQAGQLLAELRFIAEQNSNQRLILVGHSAGGLVARLALLNPAAPRIDVFITISTPNLGTTRALEGLDIAHGKPFFCPGPGVDFIKEMVGGDQYRYLRASTGVLVDLVPAEPGSLVDWMNHQSYPPIDFHAIVKVLPGSDGDDVVPAFSQDLGRVPALQGKVQLHVLRGPHTLVPTDGQLLAQIVRKNPKIARQ